MTEVFAVRDKIRDFLRKFDEVITPLFRFIVAFIVFSTMNNLFGYSTLFSKSVVVFLLSVISALVSNPLMAAIAAVQIVVSCFAVSLDTGVIALLLFVLMYCMYMRMFVRCSWVLALVPVLLAWKLGYAVPVIVAVFAGVSGAIPAAFGVLIYHFAGIVREASTMIGTKGADGEDFVAYSYIIDALTDHKKLFVMMIGFVVVVLITALLYKLPYDYSWYVAILVGGLLTILVFLIVSAKLSVTLETGALIGGSLLGIVVAALLQSIKSMVDYSKKEVVQFEDDDYFYYVKAIPKMGKKEDKDAKPAPKKKAVADTVKARKQEEITEQ